jgi:hypothetical protein
VQGALDGERDYVQLRGGTGPLVYPAGFVYVFGAMHWLTGADPSCCRLPPNEVTESDRCVSGGGDVRMAQYLFLFVYLCTQACVLDLYRRSRAVPPWALPLLCLSLRVHSLYVLRLFNDCVGMLFVYGALHFLMRADAETAEAGRGEAAARGSGSPNLTAVALLFSAAVSVKMNALLFAPAVAVLLLRRCGWRGSMARAAEFVMLQFVVGLPFLRGNWRSYVGKSFELGRAFECAPLLRPAPRARRSSASPRPPLRRARARAGTSGASTGSACPRASSATRPSPPACSPRTSCSCSPSRTAAGARPTAASSACCWAARRPNPWRRSRSPPARSPRRARAGCWRRR